MDIGPPYDRGRGGPGGWWIVDEPELASVEEQVLVPDSPDGGASGCRGFRGTIASSCSGLGLRGNFAVDRLASIAARKMRIYAEHDVPWLWLVDPDSARIVRSADHSTATSAGSTVGHFHRQSSRLARNRFRRRRSISGRSGAPDEESSDMKALHASAARHTTICSRRRRTSIAELIDGDLYTSPRPAGPHARVASALSMDIGPTVRPRPRRPGRMVDHL